MIIVMDRFRKAPFSECFPSTLTRKAGVVRFLRFKERFRKAPFLRRISVNCRANRRKKAAFSNFSGVVRTASDGLIAVHTEKITALSQCIR